MCVSYPREPRIGALILPDGSEQKEAFRPFSRPTANVYYDDPDLRCIRQIEQQAIARQRDAAARERDEYDEELCNLEDEMYGTLSSGGNARVVHNHMACPSPVLSDEMERMFACGVQAPPPSPVRAPPVDDWKCSQASPVQASPVQASPVRASPPVFDDWKRSQAAKNQFAAVFGKGGTMYLPDRKPRFTYKAGSIVVRVESGFDPMFMKGQDNISRKLYQMPVDLLLANVAWPSRLLSFHEVILADQPCRLFVDLDGFKGEYMTMIEMFQQSFLAFFAKTFNKTIGDRNFNWCESTRTKDGKVDKNSLHLTIGGFYMSSSTQVMHCMAAFRASLDPASPILEKGVFDFAPYGKNSSLRVDSSAKLVEPDRPVRQVRNHHSGHRSDSYVTDVRDTDELLPDLAAPVAASSCEPMLNDIVQAFAAHVGHPMAIRSVDADETYAWKHRVNLEGNYCARLQAEHNNRSYLSVDLLSNVVTQGCYSPRCTDKPLVSVTHTCGHMTTLFEDEEIQLPTVMALFRKLDALYGFRPVEEMLAELKGLSPTKQGCLLAKELKLRERSSFAGYFMDAIVPYLNRFWFKTTHMTQPVMIIPYLHPKFDAKDAFLTESLQLIPAFHISYGQWKLGKTELTKLWLAHEHSRTVMNIQFYPKLQDHPHIYNKFRGFNIPFEPTHYTMEELESAPDLRPLVEHIRMIWCRGDAQLFTYVMCWFAQVYQRPWDQTGVALVVKGARGSGKGIVLEFLAAIIGENHYWHVTHLNDICGGFVAPKRLTCCLGFADECYYGGDPSQSQGLKQTITERRITVNIKHVAQYDIDSFINLVVASNDDRIVQAGKGERRFQVLETDNTYAGAETPVTKAYYAQIRACCPRKFAAYLGKVNLSGFSPRTIHETEAHRDQQILSADPIDRFWYDCLTNREILFDEPWPERIVISAFYACFRAYVKESGVKYAADSQVAFMSQISRLIGRTDKARIKIGTKSAILIPSLAECMQQFNTAMGSTFFHPDM